VRVVPTSIGSSAGRATIFGLRAHEHATPRGARYLETQLLTCNDAAQLGATFGCISLWALRVLWVSGPAQYAKGRGQLA
jgi:hypothetical protein